LSTDVSRSRGSSTKSSTAWELVQQPRQRLLLPRVDLAAPSADIAKLKSGDRNRGTCYWFSIESRKARKTSIVSPDFDVSRSRGSSTKSSTAWELVQQPRQRLLLPRVDLAAPSADIAKLKSGDRNRGTCYWFSIESRKARKTSIVSPDFGRADGRRLVAGRRS
jgi:hypothetical protein